MPNIDQLEKATQNRVVYFLWTGSIIHTWATCMIEKTAILVSCLIRVFVELKPRMDDVNVSVAEQVKYEDRVNNYIKLREVI